MKDHHTTPGPGNPVLKPCERSAIRITSGTGCACYRAQDELHLFRPRVFRGRILIWPTIVGSFRLIQGAYNIPRSGSFARSLVIQPGPLGDSQIRAFERSIVDGIAD
jgi:hypothetical protein